MSPLVALVLALPAIGCQSRDCPPSAGTASSSTAPLSSAGMPKAATGNEPPTVPFAFERWVSPHKNVPPVKPPKSLLKAWRAFVNQERPRQKKNPKWQPLAPRETVTLDMHADTIYRCIVTPLEVRGRPDEEAQKVEAWVLSRKLRCSNDGWATWTEGQHTVIVGPDGKHRPVTDHLEMFLREREPGDKTRETTIFVRSDEGDKGLATKGPPRIIDDGDEDEAADRSKR